ncbi:Capsular polysaccharide synthesis protein [Ruminococcus sp. SR1/5]|nr:Capsular polysaccharide synthesis protein [Ruminococcus sp. SR1/5]
MNFEVIELNENNLFEYVKLPDKIVNMWKQKKITNANFSDLCRIALLADYGGLWIDATVFLTGKIDEKILQSDIFSIKHLFWI